jgi:hypothetical protein
MSAEFFRDWHGFGIFSPHRMHLAAIGRALASYMNASSVLIAMVKEVYTGNQIVTAALR